MRARWMVANGGMSAAAGIEPHVVQIKRQTEEVIAQLVRLKGNVTVRKKCSDLMLQIGALRRHVLPYRAIRRPRRDESPENPPQDSMGPTIDRGSRPTGRHGHRAAYSRSSRESSPRRPGETVAERFLISNARSRSRMIVLGMPVQAAASGPGRLRMQRRGMQTRGHPSRRGRIFRERGFAETSEARVSGRLPPRWRISTITSRARTRSRFSARTVRWT